MGDSIQKKGETRTIRHLLEGDSFREQVAKALPKHLTPDRFIRVAVTAMNKIPALAQCDQASFFNSLLSLSQLGLEPDGRRAHLIPFKNNNLGITECQLIIDYKGLVDLAMRSGSVANIHADVVCENDKFSYDCGEIKEHKIDFRKPRGEMYAAYAICKFKDGTVKAEVMSLEEIEGIRGRSKAGKFGPWKTDYNEMAKKTVFRRLSKWLPLSPEYRDILDHDADTFDPIALAPKANVPPPPMKKRVEAEPELAVDAEAEPVEEREPESAPEPEPPPYTPVRPGETEPPDDLLLSGETDIFTELDTKIHAYCRGNKQHMTEVYKTITEFTGRDGKTRSAWNKEQLSGWRNAEKAAHAAMRKFDERKEMGTKYRWEDGE
jgi:recombination protein RecT